MTTITLEGVAEEEGVTKVLAEEEVTKVAEAEEGVTKVAEAEEGVTKIRQEVIATQDRGATCANVTCLLSEERCKRKVPIR